MTKITIDNEISQKDHDEIDLAFDLISRLMHSLGMSRANGTCALIETIMRVTMVGCITEQEYVDRVNILAINMVLVAKSNAKILFKVEQARMDKINELKLKGMKITYPDDLEDVKNRLDEIFNASKKTTKH